MYVCLHFRQHWCQSTSDLQFCFLWFTWFISIPQRLFSKKSGSSQERKTSIQNFYIVLDQTIILWDATQTCRIFKGHFAFVVSHDEALLNLTNSSRPPCMAVTLAAWRRILRSWEVQFKEVHFLTILTGNVHVLHLQGIAHRLLSVISDIWHSSTILVFELWSIQMFLVVLHLF